MDMKRWKLVLYEWIKSTDMTDVTGSLDQVRLTEYYDKYRKVVSPESDSEIVKFLEDNFPDYEILMNETNTISIEDYVYIFSLLLYHSFVIKGNENLLKCCQKLSERNQLYIMRFIKYMRDERDNDVKITKEMLRQGIKETASVVFSPPPFIALGSPLKTPTKLERSPPPKGQSKELKHVKVQLENERFERNLLEVEVKQTQEKIESLVKKCRDLSREVQSLRNHQAAESNGENVDPNVHRVEHIKAKMEREIKTRDEKICDLKLEISELSECKQSLMEKINMIEKERKELLSKLCDFDESMNAVQAEISVKDERILYLEQSNEELVQILSEYRQKSVKDISSDCLEFSCSTYFTGMNSSGGENLGSVIDLQLKDKESEVTMLKEQLESANSEKEDLNKIIKELKSQVASLEHDKADHEDSVKALKENLSRKIDILKENLKEAMSNHHKSEKREKELEELLEREKKFNVKVDEHNEKWEKKLAEERAKLNKLQEEYNDLKKEHEVVTLQKEMLENQQAVKLCEMTDAYEEKLLGAKNKMKKLFEDSMASQKKKYSDLEAKHEQSMKELNSKIDELNKIIKSLSLENEVLVKENAFVTAQWKYKKEQQEKADKFDFANIAATSTPFTDAISPPIVEVDEEFNNEYLNELKGEVESEDIRAASELQKRNSRYPPHMRDSYAVQKLDVNMNEDEIKHGGDRTPLLSKELQKKKDGTNYRRPSQLPTPSKHGRPSIGSNTLRDATNTKIPVPKTPSMIKQLLGRMSMGKDELNRRCKKITRSVSIKKRKRIASHNADDEDSESPVLSRSTQQRELNRKEKRKSAQDMNRPRLNDKISSNDSNSSGSTVIVDDDDDDDWLEYDDDENEARTNTCELDKSLEYVKLIEEHQKHQQKMRRKSFADRRNSLIRRTHLNAQNSRGSSHDFDHFKSCLSLASDEVSFCNHSGGVHKTLNFMSSHISEVNRMSDIYVPQNRRLMPVETKKELKLNWKDLAKPLPLLIIIILTLGILALAFLKK